MALLARRCRDSNLASAPASASISCSIAAFERMLPPGRVELRCDPIEAVERLAQREGERRADLQDREAVATSACRSSGGW